MQPVNPIGAVGELFQGKSVFIGLETGIFAELPGISPQFSLKARHFMLLVAVARLVVGWSVAAFSGADL